MTHRLLFHLLTAKLHYYAVYLELNIDIVWHSTKFNDLSHSLLDAQTTHQCTSIMRINFINYHGDHGIKDSIKDFDANDVNRTWNEHNG